MFKYCIFILASICIVLTTATHAKEAIVYPDTADNPAYSLVTQLPYHEATQKISYGEDDNQYGLLWTSDETRDNPTLVVLIHGGCWLTAFDIAHTKPMATAVHQAGFNVWSLEYRRTGESGGGWPTTYEDIKSGIKAIGQLTKHGIEAKRVIIAGHSAGGHLTLLTARDNASLFSAKTEITAVGLAAISDLETYAKGDNGCQKAGVQFMGGVPETMQAAYQQANPVDHTISTPVVLLHGDKDPIVSIDQSRQFPDSNATKIEVSGAGHFDWVHPGTKAFQRFIAELLTLSQSN